MKKAILVILDGWGLGKIKSSDAIQTAHTPVMDNLYKNHPNTTLITFGEEVGLPAGQMGNSEVGHLNIGAGRIVFQELARINNSIANNTLKDEEKIKDTIKYCKLNGKPVHLMGLLSDGGVHSHINHLKALIDILDDAKVPSFLHFFLDGRDTDPKSGVSYIQDVISHISNKNSSIASIIGRYFAMDRDMRWERIKKAYDLIINGVGIESNDPIKEIQSNYKEGNTDEFMPGIIVDKDGCIKENDAVLFFNFRTDRPRQITTALSQQDLPEYEMTSMDLHFVTMTQYSEDFKGIHVIFDKSPIKDTLGEVLAKKERSQVRIAETEKYPHVTFFFSGGIESEWQGEKRILIPSPKVATYDLKPEMSAPEVTHAIIEEILSNQPDYICLNYANADMVGHTGDFQAAIKAVQCVDQCVGELKEVAVSEGYDLLIIADHGNSDYMINDDGSPNTAHTTNLVPVIYVSNDDRFSHIKSGKLADIAPTLLNIMEIEQPKLMTGENLLE